MILIEESKTESFKLQVKSHPISGEYLKENDFITISSNKPIIEINKDYIYIETDRKIRIPITNL